MDAEKKGASEVTVDDILKILGPFGKFNLYSYFWILLPIILSGIYASVYNFEAIDLPYRCAISECAVDEYSLNFTIPRDKDGELDKCHRFAPVDRYLISDVGNVSDATNSDSCEPSQFDRSSIIGCESYVYLEDHSIVKEFNLACQDWKRTMVGAVHNAGFFISIPLTGLLSDRYGRKTAIIIASVSNGLFGVMRALSLNYEMFILLEFLEPALGGGTYTACFVLALELVGPKGRVLASLLFNSMFILGGVAVTALSWWLHSWRRLLIIIYTPSILTIIYIWTLTESFRWHFSKGQYDAGLKVLQRAEKCNKVPIPKDYYVQVEKQAVAMRETRKSEAMETNQSSFNQIFTSSIIWKRLMICSFLWTASTLVYYGLSINAIQLSGNSYMNYIIIILIEAPANVCKLVLLDRYGRKKVIATAFFCTGLILVNYGFAPVNWSIVLYLGGKFFITLAYNSLYVFAAEVFPTNYRTSLLGICSTLGRTGSTVAPLTPLLAKYYAYLPTILFGVMAAISGFVVLTLPETNNRKLPDTLREAQEQDNGAFEPDVKVEDKTRL